MGLLCGGEGGFLVLGLVGWEEVAAGAGVRLEESCLLQVLDRLVGGFVDEDDVVLYPIWGFALLGEESGGELLELIGGGL